MADDLIAVLQDWPYMGETYAKEAADRIEALERERDALKAYVENDADWKFSAKRRLELFREQRSRAEAAEQLVAKLEREKREAAMDALAAYGQANDAYEAQVKAEAALAAMTRERDEMEAEAHAHIELWGKALRERDEARAALADMKRERDEAYAKGYGDCENETSLTEIGKTNEFLNGQIAKYRAALATMAQERDEARAALAEIVDAGGQFGGVAYMAKVDRIARKAIALREGGEG